MSEFYVYVHRRLSDNKPFYVGKGKGNRAYKKHGRSEYWNRVCNKHGFSVELVFENLTEQEAFDLEINTILEFKYFGYDLCNLTSGGEGLSGYTYTTEHREKLSKALVGMKRTKEEIEKSRIKRIGLKKSKEQIESMRIRQTGVVRSSDTLRKMSESQLKVSTRSDKSLYVFFSNEDVFIGDRKSFAKYSGISSRTFRTLFNKQKSKIVKGWSLLHINELILLNSLSKEK